MPLLKQYTRLRQEYPQNDNLEQSSIWTVKSNSAVMLTCSNPACNHCQEVWVAGSEFKPQLKKYPDFLANMYHNDEINLALQVLGNIAMGTVSGLQ